MDVTDADRHDTDTDGDEPSLRQKLHAATGDRDAEAKALADRSPGVVDEHDAKVAVNRAHGHATDDVRPDSEIASPDDALAAHQERDGDRDGDA